MHLLLSILLWPGRQVVRRFPNLGEHERRLLANMVNYVAWLTPTVALVIWAVIAHPPV